MRYALLFDISGGELMVILLFVLLFFGSKGIPDMARTIGRTMRQMRDASNEVQREIQRNTHDVRRAVEQQRQAFQQERAGTEPGEQTPDTAPKRDPAP